MLIEIKLMYIGRAVRQLCVIIYIQPLVDSLKSQGIWVSAYADDITVKIDKVRDGNGLCDLAGANIK